MATLKYTRTPKLDPMAKAIANARAVYGDTAFQPVADKMLRDIKRKRESRANDKAMGY